MADLSPHVVGRRIACGTPYEVVRLPEREVLERPADDESCLVAYRRKSQPMIGQAHLQVRDRVLSREFLPYGGHLDPPWVRPLAGMKRLLQLNPQRFECAGRHRARYRPGHAIRVVANGIVL